MHNLVYGTRFDKFDYNSFGVADRWYLRDTIMMLTSFEMEINGCFESQECDKIYSKIYEKYCDLITSCLFRSEIPYYNGIEYDYMSSTSPDNAPKDDKSISLDLDKANFSQEDILNYLASKDRLRLDVDRLNRFLSCKEIPKITEVGSIDKSVSHVSPPVSEQVETKEKNDDVKGKYVFINRSDYWEIVYDGERTLVKDSLGMKYLSELIKHKNEPVDWIDLHNAVKGVNPDIIDAGTAYEDVSEGFDVSQGKTSPVYAGKDKKFLQNQIEDLKKYLDEAKACDNYVEADRLEDQIEALKKYVIDTYRKDGTLKENSGSSEKMMNGIKAAIKRALEDIEGGLPDLRNHLNESIVQKWQRSKPGYFPSVGIDWEM